ncbi:MAG: hypothetical protein JWL86_5238, partial [Rhizobium sp.]|nr:hypothetical protein [Rhizobium sp.]
ALDHLYDGQCLGGSEIHEIHAIRATIK